MQDPKDEWIKTLSQDASFIDVGGLWGTVNEKVSVALRAGARKATMSDIAALDHPLWRDLERHYATLGIADFDRVQFDVTQPDPESTVGTHDIVHCSGIVYHVPDPWGMIHNLRRIARSHVILTSMVIPATLENSKGRLELQHDTALYVPSLREEPRAIVAEYLDSRGVKVAAINSPMSEPWRWPDGTPNFGPWWWLWTPAFMAEFVKSVGFRVVDEGWSWEGLSYSLLLQKAD